MLNFPAMYSCHPGDNLWCHWVERTLPGEESGLKCDVSIESIKWVKFLTCRYPQVAVCLLPPLNCTSALGRLMSGMLNWLTEGLTLAGLENKLCLVTKVGPVDLDVQTGHELCATPLCYRSSLSFHGQARCGLCCISQDPQSIRYSTRFVWGFGSSVNVVLTEHLWLKMFNTAFPRCFANSFQHSPELEVPSLKKKGLRTFLLSN